MGNNQLIWQHQNSKDGDRTTVATQSECKADAVAWQYNFIAGQDLKGLGLGLAMNF